MQMIASKCFKNDWVMSVQAEMPHADKLTIERSIHALALLEHLGKSGLHFVFKGGTCMMLHLKDVRRLSVDIDIVCTEGMTKISPVLEEISHKDPFKNWDEDKRNPDRRPKRKHFRFFYNSLDSKNPEPFVSLDVVLESVPHPFTERKPVLASFIETTSPPGVLVPTLDGLLGDKLTAFAPETVGIRYHSKVSQQIIKQMFDIGELFQLAADLDKIRRAHETSFVAENSFRRNQYQLKQALEDSLVAAYRVSQLNLTGERQWDAKKRGILLAGIGAINVTLVRETYTVEDARISASRAGLLAAFLRIGRSGQLARVRFVPTRAHELPHSLTGQYAVFNPLREIATEAFHNWHQVQILEAEMGSAFIK